MGRAGPSEGGGTRGGGDGGMERPADRDRGTPARRPPRGGAAAWTRTDPTVVGGEGPARTAPRAGRCSWRRGSRTAPGARPFRRRGGGVETGADVLWARLNQSGAAVGQVSPKRILRPACVRCASSHLYRSASVVLWGKPPPSVPPAPSRHGRWRTLPTPPALHTATPLRPACGLVHGHSLTPTQWPRPTTVPCRLRRSSRVRAHHPPVAADVGSPHAGLSVLALDVFHIARHTGLLSCVCS